MFLRDILSGMVAATTFDLPGYRVLRSLGVVRGITVRRESFQLMIAHARKLGANAVVGVRYDTGPMVGAAEVLCHGTAVVVEAA